MIRETVKALLACVVSFVICAAAYPAAVWGLGQLLFPRQAEGSLIYDRDRTVIGSELIAQPFTSDRYFHPRPSAADYKGDAASGSNLGTKNPDLHTKIEDRAKALHATEGNPAPADLVTASGCGLDPHITPEGAYYQVAAVAEARKMPVEQVRKLVERFVETSGALIGAPARVNVLKLNLALDAEQPAPAAASIAPEPSPIEAGPAQPSPDTRIGGDVEAIRSQVVAIVGVVGHMNGRLDEMASARPAEPAHAESEVLQSQVERLSAEVGRVALLNARVNDLGRSLDATGQTIRTLRDEVAAALKTLKTMASSPSH